MPKPRKVVVALWLWAVSVVLLGTSVVLWTNSRSGQKPIQATQAQPTSSSDGTSQASAQPKADNTTDNTQQTAPTGAQNIAPPDAPQLKGVKPQD